jgi:hypothetical protein
MTYAGGGVVSRRLARMGLHAAVPNQGDVPMG